MISVSDDLPSDSTPNRTRLASPPRWRFDRQWPVQYQRAESPLKIKGLAAARKFFAGCLAEVDPTRESLWVAHLDPELRCLHVSQHEGDTTGIDFPLHNIILDAARHQSAAVVLAHNHPSGDS